ncbi:hypothetical protein J3A83DRAFT_4162131 [Scleroderma citrinum]
MPSMPKLTKRTKKSIAFRNRKQGKNQRTTDLEENDVPILEHQILAESGVDLAEGEEGDETSTRVVGDDRAGNPQERQEGLVGSKKRKREAREEAQGPADKPKLKRRRGSSGGPVDDVVDGDKKTDTSKRRFILFLGNIKYTTTVEAIQAHFSACDTPPTVRLLTPKPSTDNSRKTVTKSKGCAFLEFQNRTALQQALKLHHSQLDGRTINVELTAGGGGKGEARLKKLKERNKELEGQRRKHVKKILDEGDDARRFSATSGAEQVHSKKRTWTVGQAEEIGTRRGGKKHAKRGKARKPKDIGTGVNAIPVG